MGLELPSELTEPLSWIGMTWPEADEGKLFEAGNRWLEFGTRLQAIGSDADAAAGDVWKENQGETVDAVHRWWDGEQGPPSRVAEDAVAAQIIGAALIVFAAVTLALKIAFIVQLIMLAIEVAQ